MINASQILVLNKRIISLTKGILQHEENRIITWLSHNMCVLAVSEYASKRNTFILDAVEYFLLVDIEPEKFAQILSTREYLELRKVAYCDDQHNNSF